MAQFVPLVLDIVSKRLVASVVDATPVVLPEFYSGEILSVEFQLVKRRSTFRPPLFERVSLSGASLVLSIGTAGVVNAQNASWTMSGDGFILNGDINLNTTEILALADGAEQKMELRISGTQPGVAQFPITIKKPVFVTGATIPNPTDPSLGVLEANRKYVKKEGSPGEGFILTSENGLSKGILYWGNDGSLRAEPLS